MIVFVLVRFNENSDYMKDLYWQVKVQQCHIILKFTKTALLPKLFHPDEALSRESCHNANFVVSGGAGCCCYENSRAINNDKIGIMKTVNFQWVGGYVMDNKNVNENIDWLR